MLRGVKCRYAAGHPEHLLFYPILHPFFSISILLFFFLHPILQHFSHPILHFFASCFASFFSIPFCIFFFICLQLRKSHFGGSCPASFLFAPRPCVCSPENSHVKDIGREAAAWCSSFLPLTRGAGESQALLSWPMLEDDDANAQPSCISFIWVSFHTCPDCPAFHTPLSGIVIQRYPNKAFG